MKGRTRAVKHFLRLLPAVLLMQWGGVSLAENPLANTRPLLLTNDLSMLMLEGIDRFLTRKTELAIEERQRLWNRDFSSPAAYEASIKANRDRLRETIGAVDVRVPAKGLEFVAGTEFPSRVAETKAFTIDAVRWLVFEDVYAEGLWLRPKGNLVARVVALPDADQTPEVLVGLAPGLEVARQFARRLAEQGCEVLVPVLISRQDDLSGSETVGRFTNQTHREWLYRQAFQLGRHIIGYEVQKVLAAVDFFELENRKEQKLIGVVGYGEGGLLAFYAAALDTRVAASLVSGYFSSRQELWGEPIYRNIWKLLAEFGDAEIATLVTPRALVIEHSPAPEVPGPPSPRQGRSGAAPGSLTTPDYNLVEAEFQRFQELVKKGAPKQFDRASLITGTEGMTTGPGSDRALRAFLEELGHRPEALKRPDDSLADGRGSFDPNARQRRQFNQLQEHTQRIYRRSEREREKFFWSHLQPGPTQDWTSLCAPFRKMLLDDIVGQLPSPTMPPNPRTRSILDRPKWSGNEVMLDVNPDVFAWGYLLVPKDLKPGERRPVVVCQHGVEGSPASVVEEDPESRAYKPYKAFAARLAERGFIVFAPHNPYRGRDQFRQLQRKAHPLGCSLFAVITAQHRQILKWLSGLEFVDPSRIGFYGLSYGGKTAMRVPAVLDGYALSICSGDFNEWIGKTVSLDFDGSYMFTGEYEIGEWNVGNTFNYGEMAALISPRPFMVERGHQDGVGLDEWVAYEYAKVRRLYAKLGIGDRTEIEFFDGPHTINGKGTFKFLHRHLKWPQPAE